MGLIGAVRIEASFQSYVQKHVASEDRALFEANVMLALFEDPSREAALDWKALANRGAEIRTYKDKHGWKS